MNQRPRATRTAPVVGGALAAGALATVTLVAATGLFALVA